MVASGRGVTPPQQQDSQLLALSDTSSGSSPSLSREGGQPNTLGGKGGRGREDPGRLSLAYSYHFILRFYDCVD